MDSREGLLNINDNLDRQKSAVAFASKVRQDTGNNLDLIFDEDEDLAQKELHKKLETLVLIKDLWMKKKDDNDPEYVLQKLGVNKKSRNVMDILQTSKLGEDEDHDSTNILGDATQVEQERVRVEGNKKIRSKMGVSDQGIETS